MENAHVEIEYCTKCRWLARAAWVAQEILQTFEQDIARVSLISGAGGVFEVRVEGRTVWSRSKEGRFPQPKELKQRIRDVISPEKELGHAEE